MFFETGDVDGGLLGEFELERVIAAGLLLEGFGENGGGLGDGNEFFANLIRDSTTVGGPAGDDFFDGFIRVVIALIYLADLAFEGRAPVLLDWL